MPSACWRATSQLKVSATSVALPALAICALVAKSESPNTTSLGFGVASAAARGPGLRGGVGGRPRLGLGRRRGLFLFIGRRFGFFAGRLHGDSERDRAGAVGGI